MSGGPIEGYGETVQTLFTGKQYRLGDYQREYSWSEDAVSALLADLHRRFMANWSVRHDRQRTATYEPYFLGPYVFHEEDGVTYLVDGQQRFTTLHLLLIYLQGLLHDQDLEGDVKTISALISTQRYGRRSFTIDITERHELLDAMLDRREVVLPDRPTPSQQNLVARFEDIDTHFSSDLRGEALPYFFDWLLERVCLVGIKALDRDNGWEIFESMNNRGVPLGPVDLLKSHLLFKSDPLERKSLNKKWRRMITTLAGLSDVQENAVSKFLKTVLWAEYADLSSESSDYDDIAKSFHEWVRRTGKLDLLRPSDYAALVEKLARLSESYSLLVSAGGRYSTDPRLQPVFYNAHNSLDFQYTLIFASIDESDDPQAVKEKAGLLASFIDLIHVRRFVNNETSEDALERDLLDLVPAIRAAGSLDELRALLATALPTLARDFSEMRAFALRQNRHQVKYLLARLTAFVDKGCGDVDHCGDYLSREKSYQIEHIWSVNCPYKTIPQFDTWRNRLGALLLLPGSDNASYRDDDYKDKLERYRSQNRLASVLHPGSHVKNPGLSKFKNASGLGELLRAFPEDFNTDAIEKRQLLYRRLCEVIWSPDRLGLPVEPAPAASPEPKRRKPRAHYGVTLVDLVDAGMVPVGATLRGQRKKDPEPFTLTVQQDGRLRAPSGEVLSALSTAGQVVCGTKSCDGWKFWRIERDGAWVMLSEVRQIALDRGLVVLD